jgi:dipeptidase E
MRLYLSSFRLGNQPERLVDLVRDNKNALVILNACDMLMEHERQIRVEQEIAALQGLGFGAEELDLREYFNNEPMRGQLSALLATRGLVWVRGGNSFVLRRAMKASGFDETISDFLERDAIVYGGFSAAIAVLTPSLHGIELVDDPNIAPPGYDADIVWACLGLLPYAVAPHYKSDHPESADIDKTVQYYIDHHMLFKALRDGETIVVDGEQEELLS